MKRRWRSVLVLVLFGAVGYLAALIMLDSAKLPLVRDVVASTQVERPPNSPALRTANAASAKPVGPALAATSDAGGGDAGKEAAVAGQHARTVPGQAVAGQAPTGTNRACSADMVLVDGWFCPILAYPCVRYVDRREKYRCAEYARERRCLGEPDHRRYCIDRYEWPNRVGAKPRVYVSWHEAKALCQSVSKRLCRRSEWVLACEGPKRLPYPWGYVRQPSPCNIDRAPIAFDAMAMEVLETRQEELDRLWQGDPIGSHPDCVSAFGVFDMSGNVDEWTDNQADNPHTQKPSTLNGGYWGPVRDTCRLTTKSHGPKFRFYQVGFRCCRDSADTAELRATGKLAAPKPWIEPERPNKAVDGANGSSVYED